MYICHEYKYTFKCHFVLYTYVVFIMYSSHSTEHGHIRNLHGIVYTHTHTDTHTI